MVMPPSNLSPEAQPWAREVEAQLRSATTQFASLDSNINAAFAGINGSLQQLSGQIAAIAAQNAALAAQQAALTTVVSDLATVSANQVAGSTGTNSASVTVTASAVDYAVITFTVPTGYTRANVMAVSSYTGGGTTASILTTKINGASSPDMYAFNNAAYASVTASYAQSLTGLSGGGTFTVASNVRTTGSPTTTSAVILTSASVIWLK